MTINQATFGDSRLLILKTIMELRDGTMDVSRGMAIAANMKVLNDSVQTEINAAKMTILAQKEGYGFGKIVGMGQKVIGECVELETLKPTLAQAAQRLNDER